jgi:hypothetical protein
MTTRLDALASYLRLIRWSGSELARQLDMTPAYVNGCISGTRKPSARFKRDTALILSPFFGLAPIDAYTLFFTRGAIHA